MIFAPYLTIGLASFQVLLAQDTTSVTAPAPGNQSDSAVTEISNQSFWLEDIFAKGSPVHLGLTAGETYDDNIFISPQKTPDFVTNLSPSIDFEKGDRTAPHENYFNGYFSPTFFLYNRNPAQDRQNYNVDLYDQYQWTRLTLGLEEQYLHLTDATIDVGNLVKRDIYKTAVSGNYVYNDKLIISGDAFQRITSYPTRTGVDTTEWVVESYALYQIAPKLQLGGGPRINFIDISGSPNETHQDLLMHLNYNPEGKITATFSGGVEYLQFQGDSSSYVLPIFDLSANYTPQDGTTLSFLASRQSINSYDEGGVVYLNTALQLSVKQRVLQDVYFTLSGGYTLSDYEFGALPVTGVQRSDNYYFANAGVEWDPKIWLKVSARVEHSQDDSNFQQNTFKDNQIGVQTSVQF